MGRFIYLFIVNFKNESISKNTSSFTAQFLNKRCRDSKSVWCAWYTLYFYNREEFCGSLVGKKLKIS